jgi:mannose-6-phosphate isomerase-like protein (cupin superfamily)
MAEYSGDIEKQTIRNNNYRKVIGTTNNMQLVLMSLEPGEEIGFETHPHSSQFFRIEQGQAKAIISERSSTTLQGMKDKSYELNNGSALMVPPNTKHNIINVSATEKLKLYTIYTPPIHKKKCVQKLKSTPEC